MKTFLSALAAILFMLFAFSPTAHSDDRPACVLEVTFDGNTPPWLFWLFKKGTAPCKGGVSACLTADGKGPPASPIEEGDIFSGVCWETLPKGAVAVNESIIDAFIQAILPYLFGPTLLDSSRD